MDRVSSEDLSANTNFFSTLLLNKITLGTVYLIID